MKTKKQIVQDTLSEGYAKQLPIGVVIEKCMEEYAEAKAGQHETLVNSPKPFTAEFLTFLLVNALRNLNEAQRHNLAISLAVRDPFFTIEEYEKQKEN